MSIVIKKTNEDVESKLKKILEKEQEINTNYKNLNKNKVS